MTKKNTEILPVSFGVSDWM